MRHVCMPASLILALASTFPAIAQQPPSTQPAAQSGSRPISDRSPKEKLPILLFLMKVRLKTFKIQHLFVMS